MNVQFEYLYRDAGNFRNRGQVIFSNPNDIATDTVTAMAKKALIDETYFIASKVGVPDLHFAEYIPHLDLDWHEVYAFLPTNNPPTDPHSRNIEEFIVSLQQAISV